MTKVDRHLVETLIRTRTLYRGKAVNFRVDDIRLPNGARATREYMDHPGAVAAVPFLDEKTIILVRQYRHPIGRVTLEIPAGKLHRGERPLPCLRRELREETGYTAGRIVPLLNYWPTPAFANELIRIYLAQNLRPGPVSPDEDEFIETVEVPFRRAVEWALSGRIQDSKTVIALLACALKARSAGRKAF